MYAIAFDFDPNALADARIVPADAHAVVRSFLTSRRFSYVQDGLYFDQLGQGPVLAVLAIRAILESAGPWFKDAVRHIKLLRIEEDSDLKACLD